jgi:hypothetical protein
LTCDFRSTLACNIASRTTLTMDKLLVPSTQSAKTKTASKASVSITPRKAVSALVPLTVTSASEVRRGAPLRPLPKSASVFCQKGSGAQTPTKNMKAGSVSIVNEDTEAVIPSLNADVLTDVEKDIQEIFNHRDIVTEEPLKIQKSEDACGFKSQFDQEEFEIAMKEIGFYDAGANFFWQDFKWVAVKGVPINTKAVKAWSTKGSQVYSM